MLPGRRHCIASALLGALGTAVATAESAQACTGLAPGPARTVTRILDGETVALDDGTELRLIGALAPRAIDVDAEPGAWPVESAAMRALRHLALGKSVELGFPGGHTDRYGRLQAHAFLIEGDTRRWIQRHLVEHGFARAYALAGVRRCSGELLAAERTARAARRGLWANAAYQVRRADKPGELLRYRATFQLVEGGIVRVALRRRTIYLNFSHRWWRGFSASLRRNNRRLLGAYAANPRGLEGRRVRVRGWIEQRGRGTIIDLSAGGLIEVLEAGGRTGVVVGR